MEIRDVIPKKCIKQIRLDLLNIQLQDVRELYSEKKKSITQPLSVYFCVLHTLESRYANRYFRLIATASVLGELTMDQHMELMELRTEACVEKCKMIIHEYRIISLGIDMERRAWES